MNLPYGLSEEDIRKAIRSTELFFSGFSSSHGPPLLEVIPKSAISSMVSDIIIYNISEHCDALTKNMKVGGYPDLLDSSRYSTTSISSGEHGIEVKSSMRNNAWDSHNPESGWFMTVSFTTHGKTVLIKNVSLAHLNASDWNYSPKKTGSRRTATARINKSGLIKLRAGKVYSI